MLRQQALNLFCKINISGFAEFLEAMFSVWKLFSLDKKVKNIKEDV